MTEPVVLLTDRLSVALGAEPPDACPGDLAMAAEAVIVAWLREQARAEHSWQESRDPRTVREVLEWLAERVENGYM